jgi:guanine deaminase
MSGAARASEMMKEALQAYLVQRLAPSGVMLSPRQMLYLATLAGAQAVGLAEETGSFQPGKAADLVYLRPRPASALAYSLETAATGDQILSALFTQAGAETIREVRVEGETVYRAAES